MLRAVKRVLARMAGAVLEAIVLAISLAIARFAPSASTA
jgi:hypothetical protein